MDQDGMEQGLRNLDHRVERIEQILPTLATGDDLRAAIETPGDQGEAKSRHRAPGDQSGATRGQGGSAH